MESWMPVSQAINGAGRRSSTLQPLQESLWFRAIPPERVGVLGEYDFYGLAKRVMLQYREVLGSAAITNLTVRQRGSVVILSGQVKGMVTVSQLMHLAMQVEGTTYVEVRGLTATEAVYPQGLTTQLA